MVKFSRSNQRLNGLNPLAYIGDNSYQPPEFVTDTRPPTPTDAQNFELGTIWLDISTNVPPEAENIWMLVALLGGVATWVNFAAGTFALESLTGNTGGPVFSDVNDNINVVGDGIGITITGNPATHTLTASLIGGGATASIVGLTGLYSINLASGITWSALFQSQVGSSLQASSNTVVPLSGTFSNLFVLVTANNAANINTLTVNKNNVNTSIQVTIPAGTTGVFSDTTHSVAFAQGDLIQFEASQSSAGTEVSGQVSMRLVA